MNKQMSEHWKAIIHQLHRCIYAYVVIGVLTVTFAIVRDLNTSAAHAPTICTIWMFIPAAMYVGVTIIAIADAYAFGQEDEGELEI